MLTVENIQLSENAPVKGTSKIFKRLSFLTFYRLRWIVLISIVWTIIWLLLYYRMFYTEMRYNYPYTENDLSAYFIRAIILLLFSALMAYLLLIELRVLYRNISILAGWAIKIFMLLLIAAVCTALIFISHYIVLKQQPLPTAFSQLVYYFTKTGFFIDSLFTWLTIILITQVMMEANQHYSPGMFWQILRGKYSKPRTEKRIIMFLDLKDSTPIAEKLGHEQYFSFIKDFIYYVTSAIWENGGYIYQYVGDEVVVTWPYRKSNIIKPTNSVVLALYILKQASNYFQRKYGVIPEFRVGLHVGNVTIGEIGIMKKDIAISGEAMNIAARIRTACTELNQKFIVSQNYFENNVLQSWQGENLGEVELKGVEKPVKLYALKL